MTDDAQGPTLLKRGLYLGPQNPVDKAARHLSSGPASPSGAGGDGTAGGDAAYGLPSPLGQGQGQGQGLAAGTPKPRPLTCAPKRLGKPALPPAPNPDATRPHRRASALITRPKAPSMEPSATAIGGPASPTQAFGPGAGLRKVSENGLQQVPRNQARRSEGGGGNMEVDGEPKGGVRFQHSSQPRGILPHRMRGLPSPLPDDDADAEQRQEPASPAATAAAARIRMWYQLLQTFKQQPDSIEFVYLRHADPAGTEWNPYNLEVVPHGGIKGLPHYYTLSSNGVTTFLDGTTDFCSLEQFERDYFLFTQMMRLRLFKHFRMWKAFKVWRRSVVSHKTKVSRELLTKQLFILHPVFREAILHVRRSCVELTALRLHALQPGRTYSLDEMVAAHAAHCTEVAKLLDSFSKGVVVTAQAACKQAVELMEETLLASKDRGDAKSTTVNNTNLRLALAKATKMANQTEFSYAINAARRSEKRRVHAFVRMLDYMICDALHTLLAASIDDMRCALTPAPAGTWMAAAAASASPAGEQAASAADGAVATDVDPFSTVSANAEGLGSGRVNGAAVEGDEALVGGSWGGPLVVLTVHLADDGSDELLLEPDPRRLVQHMMDVQVGFVDQMKSVTRLVVNDKLQDFMEKPIDGGSVDLEGLQEMVMGSDHGQLVEEVMLLVDEAIEVVEAYKTSFGGLRDRIVEDRGFNAEKMQRELTEGVRDLDSFRQDIERYRREVKEVQSLPHETVLGVLRVVLTPMIAAFQPSFESCLQAIYALLPQLANTVYQTFIQKVHQATSRLQRSPSSVEEFAEYLEFLGTVEKSTKDWDHEYNHVEAHYELMADFGIKVPAMQQASYHTMEQDYQAMRDALWLAESHRESLVQLFRSDLDAQVEGLNKEVVDIRLLAQHDMILDEHSRDEQVLAYTKGLLNKVDTQQEEASRINRFQRLFKLEETKFQELDDCSEDCALRNQLWASRRAWAELTQGWLDMRLDAVAADPAPMEEAVIKYNKAVFRMEKGLVPNKVVPKLRGSVNVWREFVPVVQALCNSDMRDRHWAKIAEVTKIRLERGDKLTLRTLMDSQISQHKEAVLLISTEATQEAALQLLLDKVHDKWRHVEFMCNPYKDMKDTYILGGVDEVMAVLEDSMVMVSNITSSRFVAGISAEVERTEKALRVFSDTLDEWTECQRQWLYLETIFSAADIQRQLPTEAKAFWQVDKEFKNIMRRTRDRPNALQAGTAPGLYETLLKCNNTLEVVQKNLEDYLEVKRVSFPRFYFLSNDELLEILSQTKNPQAVQPHLQKCFDGIRLLDFGSEPKSIDILAMLSGEGERIALTKNLRARGNVEAWLTNVEGAMRNSMRALAKKGVKEYPETERCAWVLSNPAQLVIVVSNIYWCQAVEAILCGPAAPNHMSRFYEQCVEQLAALTALVRGKLTPLERKVLVALITIDVHNRDITESLVHKRCSSTGDFTWQMQLRYEYDAETESVIVRQVQARFEYGYEYIGAQPRLVVTPMTDRCYMTLTGALHLRLGGAPAGPAGTGKTETTKDLGKGLGIQCVVFNCGENLDYKFMGKFFSGLAQCGAWACFDEFNRIDIEVLSVVAQQLLAIQNALRAGQERFIFEGREIALKATCGVFITMNPGYAGRTELPDNLKALFRPVSMMIPDYALVAEVMLFSEGFNAAKTLSRKMVQLYKLASEQLSQQDHYDFGMRALKSVLVMAGTLKRAHPDLNEDIVLIRAMRDSNIPKFLSDDARLFNAIVSDLFPDVEIPDQDYGVLQVAVVESCKQANLQPVQPFITKVVQLYETFNVRFGVMLVGPTGGGKTQIHRMLAKAATLLRAQQHPDTGFQAVHTWALNPKSVKMGELYGEYNALTSEWQDGIASSLIRAAVTDSRPDHHWVLMDGPVDAVWVENLNTVLDDNCMLCLPNGERIKLNPVTMRMLFEVADLAVASPATVSRCGMVYVPPENMGWRPFVRSWLDQLASHHAANNPAPPELLASPSSAALALPTPATDDDDPTSTQQPPSLASALSVKSVKRPLHYHPESLDFVFDLFDRFVDPLLAHIRQQCKEAVSSVDINLVTSTAKIFEAVSAPIDFSVELDDATRISVQYIFAYSLIWGVGGNLDSTTWDKFDVFVRGLLEGTANFPGGSGTVFEYRLDPSRGFTLASWDELVPSFKYLPEQPYHQILVHTTDTIRMASMLETCLGVGRPVLLNGSSGVGKSAVVVDSLERLSKSGATNYMPVVLNFSAQTTSEATQSLIESRLEKKRRHRFGAPAGKHLVLFVDDLNMPAKEAFGAQPPLELLRQLKDGGGFYDRKKLFWKEIEGLTLVAACGPPGGGRQEVTPRLLRHFMMLCMPAPSEAAMRHIFGAILGGFMTNYFPAEVRTRMLKPMVQSSVDVYLRMCTELLPTPAKAHYTFNLRDLSKVFQGLVTIRPGQCPEPRTTLTRLWVHENMRVFHDRLINKEDKDYFTHMLHELLRSRFEVREDYEDMFVKRTTMFGDYLRMGTAPEDRVYEELSDPSGPGLLNLLESYLEEYNLEHKPRLQLVFFADAVQHISRIARILRQPRGSVMLVGVGGSGKQSLTRFAAFVSDTRCFSIELTRSYALNEFREDLKKLYRACGVDGQRVAFLFTDNHIVSETFVEDINSILNSGEITGLFPQDERERVFSDIRKWVAEEGIEETREAMWKAFISRVRDNLHLVLAMSPVGEAFRARCRQFPSLINCTTIDWFDAWPAEALLSVSRRFLSAHDLGTERLSSLVSEMCVVIHNSVEQTAERFFQELRRRFYVTPKSYLDLIHLYTRLLKDKRQEMALARERLLNGLQKLTDTNILVDKMQRELNELQPILAAKTVDTEQLLVQVDAERKDAEVIRATVLSEEHDVKLKQAETQLLKDDAQTDLEEVLPALEAAEKALNALNKNDIIELKTFTKPPHLVQLTMEGVCILLHERADWETAKKVLGEVNFIKRLVDFDKDNISDKVVRTIKRIIDDPAFTPDQVAKQSKAAMSMCLWVRAMDTYAQVIKIVEPKRQILREAQEALDAMNGKLEAKQQQLKDIEAKVERLQTQLEETQKELQSLQFQADLSQKRLMRAGKLTSALADESVRWKTTAEDLGERMQLLVGDVFLSAACISYIGAFTGSYRQQLVGGWVAGCKERNIPTSPMFTLQNTLATPVEVREWNAQGLPTDGLSIDNGILVSRGSRWPLMVDPQDQANRWIKAMEGPSSLRVIKATDPNVLRTLEASLRIGTPVLMEDVGETLDPALDTLLHKQTFVVAGRMVIRIGDSDVDYDPNFKFYMTTKMSNPHYLPEVCIKVNLINFTVTIQGLEDQLLGEVVRKERPELEEARDRLVVSMSNDKRLLQDLEDKILKLLREATGNILDDEVLINTLNNSKATSGVIQTRVAEAEETEAQINEAREVYREVPIRGSILYFVVADLAQVDPMYQYSLSYFTQLFNHCLDASPPSDQLPVRLQSLLSFTTEFMYKTVCRGLFEVHKLLLSFLICTAIQRHAHVIAPQSWDFFLRGSSRLLDSPKAMPPDLAVWLNPAAWQAVQQLERAVPEMWGMSESMSAQPDAWRAFAQATDPDLHDLSALSAALSHAQAQAKKAPPAAAAAATAAGAPEEAGIGAFSVLLLVKVLCEDKLLGSMQRYVAKYLGTQFTEAPPSSLPDIYADSTPATPIIFILSQGADPTAALIKFNQTLAHPVSQSMSHVGHGHGHAAAPAPAPSRLHIVSLGQGQGPIAESLLNNSIKTGDWVCLQNCHLARSWMPSLERIVEGLQARYHKQQLAHKQGNKDAAVDLDENIRKRVVSEPGVALTEPAPVAEGEGKGRRRGGAAGGRGQDGEEGVDVHPHFRLWLTSMPSEHFPVPVLQSGIKITMEPPRGVRANMMRTFTDLPPLFLEAPEQPLVAPAWRSLVFACAWFHALVQERRKFGPLGWNIRYEFSSGDLDCALQTLRMFLLQGADAPRPSARTSLDADGDGDMWSHHASALPSHQASSAGLHPHVPRTSTSGPHGGGRVSLSGSGYPVRAHSIPWEALRYVTGEINYGGRVTDENDRRLLMCVLGRCYDPAVLKPGHPLSSSGAYRTPADSSEVSAYTTFVRGLPHRDDPEAFGLHGNANITFNLQETRRLLDTVLSIQPRVVSSGSGKSMEVVVLELAADIEAQLPKALDLEKPSVVRNPFAPLPSGHDNSLGTVLAQEATRFNSLLSLLRRSLADLARSMRGLAVMSAELEATCSSLLNNQVPALWQRAAYPSLKPLASWVANFKARMEFMASWLYDGEPSAFWLPGFFFPQGFLTAVLQNHARKMRIPIDRLSFSFTVTDHDSHAELAQHLAANRTPRPSGTGGPDAGQPQMEGVYVHGLFLESARWDKGQRCLQSPRPREMTSHLPPLHFLPTTSPSAGAGLYECPLYKTTVRAGLLSTTGQSTNWILHITLPCAPDCTPADFVLSGVAALCALDD